MKSLPISLITFRKLFRAMADPNLSARAVMMSDGNDIASFDPQDIPLSSMSMALRQLGLLKRLPGPKSDR